MLFLCLKQWPKQTYDFSVIKSENKNKLFVRKFFSSVQKIALTNLIRIFLFGFTYEQVRWVYCTDVA